MSGIILIVLLLLIAVFIFVFLLKRKHPEESDVYVCDKCGEEECVCHKEK